MEDKIYITEDEFLTLQLAVSSLRDDLELAAKSDYVVKEIIYPHSQEQIQKIFDIINRIQKEQHEKAEIFKKEMEKSRKQISEYIKRREEKLKRAEETLCEINADLDRIKSEYDI